MKLNIVLGVVTIAIAFIVFPIILEATDTILANENLSDYTGLGAIVKIAPMIAFVGIFLGGGLLTFKGVKEYRRTRKASKKGRN